MNKQLTLILVGAGAAIAVYVYLKQKGTVPTDSAYADKGVVGTLGYVTDQASGGYLSRIGGYLGRTFYDLTHSNPT